MRYNANGDLLDALLEGLDEEYCNPFDDSGRGQENEAMRQAEKAFVEAVCAQYVPWRCEPSKTIRLNAADWLREHRPDVLAQVEAQRGK